MTNVNPYKIAKAFLSPNIHPFLDLEGQTPQGSSSLPFLHYDTELTMIVVPVTPGSWRPKPQAQV